MRRAALAALLALVGAAPASDEKPAGRVTAAEQVVRIVVDAYVTDSRGDPVLDLLPSDFVVTADGKRLEVESCEFVAAGASEGLPPAPAPAVEGASAAPVPPPYPPGRVLVLFIEGDIARMRQKGLMQVRQQLFRLLDRLQPTDRVAVVRFYSHLTVLCDFTNDRAVLDEALVQGLGAGADRDIRVSPFPSLAANLDFPEARRAAHVERGLELVANALVPIPGGKAIVFAGWGFFANHAPVEGLLYGRALAALMRARANVFMLDTTDADYHTLETSLMVAAEVTGGTYQRTHIFPGGAVERLARTLSGRWVLVCVAPDAAPRALTVSLADRRGEVVARAYTAIP